MAKTFVVKGADFSAHALAHVSFNSIPCQGIELDKTSVEIVNIGSIAELIPIVVPVDCSDTVVWSTTNPDVVSVENGIVTAVGLGTANIIAKCGDYSASCTVAVRAFMDTPNAVKVAKAYLSGDVAVDGGNGLPTFKTNDLRGAIVSNSGELSYYQAADYYPFKMPVGAKRIKITINNAVSSVLRTDVLQWFNSNTHSASNVATCKLIGKTTNSQIVAEKVYDIPTFAGFPAIDAVGILFRNGDVSFTEDLFDAVTVEFLAE